MTKPALARPSYRSLAAALACTAMLVSGCGGGKGKAEAPLAAKVNKDEITLAQVNFVLQQQRGLRPDQADAAGRQALERLVEQSLAVQKADELKLDQDPRIALALDAARRDVLARAYVEKVGEGATKPTAEEIHKYYEDKPALFRERRLYNLQEINIEARPDQVEDLRARIAASKSMTEFIDYLKANDLRYAGNQAVRAAEQLPLASLDAFARLQDGQAMVTPAANGLQVVVLAGSRAQPIGEEQAKPAIEQYLLNERKRKRVEEDLKALRAAARIEYAGKFAAASASSAVGSAAVGAASGAASGAAPK